jgi:hypothetical protein
VGPKAGLDDVGKRKFLTLPGLELRPLGRPARSQSLYRLRYPGSWTIILVYFKNCKLRLTMEIHCNKKESFKALIWFWRKKLRSFENNTEIYSKIQMPSLLWVSWQQKTSRSFKGNVYTPAWNRYESSPCNVFLGQVVPLTVVSPWIKHNHPSNVRIRGRPTFAAASPPHGFRTEGMLHSYSSPLPECSWLLHTSVSSELQVTWKREYWSADITAIQTQ